MIVHTRLTTARVVSKCASSWHIATFHPPFADSELTRALDRDAWASCASLSRTEAKTRYIDTLISTMHTYASTTADARALVAELEFVWDQVRGNATAESVASRERRAKRKQSGDGSGLRVLRPMSDMDEEDVAREEEDEEEDEQDDAAADARDRHPEDDDAAERRSDVPQHRPPGARPPHDADAQWQRRIERAIVRLTAEVAAVREQLDTSSHSLWAGRSMRALSPARGARGWLHWLLWRAWRLSLRATVDALIVAAVLAGWSVWSGRKAGGMGAEAGMVPRASVGALRDGWENVEAWVGWWWSRLRRKGRRTEGG